MRIADINSKSMDNAFWLMTGDLFEIDIAEAQYPNYVHIALQKHASKANPGEKLTSVGWGVKFTDNLSSGFHDYGMLWTPTEMIFEVDGEPAAAVVTNQSVKGPADLRLSSALGLNHVAAPDHPEGNDVIVKSVRVIALQ